MSRTKLSTIRRRLASEAGFTLAEALVTLAILGVVMGALTQLFISATNAQLKITNRFSAQQNARLALDALRREIHCASALTADGTNALVPPASKLVITLALSCPTNTSGVDPAYSVWCMRSLTSSGALSSTSTSRKGLFRYLATTKALAASVTSSPCGTTVSGVPAPLIKADYLTTGQVFTAFSAGGSGSRAKLSVNLPVNVDKTGGTADAYDLTDDIVLRNTSR